MKAIDIKTAFLQGDLLNRDVYIIPPPESECPPNVWKLNKCVYGLSDASLQWYLRIKSFVINSGGVISKLNPSLFLWYDQDKQLRGLMAVHVDDFLCKGSHKFLASLISKIENAYTVGKEESHNFRYVGLNIQCVNSNISVDQFSYIKGLNKVEINSSAKSSDVR